MPPSITTTETTTFNDISSSPIKNNFLKNGSEFHGKNAPLDYIKPDDVRIKINGKWLNLSKEFVAKHPGGSVINQYRNADATHIFHAFHEGSQSAYKQLKILESLNSNQNMSFPDNYYPSTMHQQLRIRTLSNSEPTTSVVGVNIGNYDIPLEKEMKIVENFERLRQRVHYDGLMEKRPYFYVRKVFEIIFIFALVFSLQFYKLYLISAIVLGICWQQLGWLTHEFCHHQPFKNRRINDVMSIICGNIAQGFSRDWWKDKHNVHHAATNIIDQDGDIDLAPLVALVPSDLRKYKQPLEKLILKIIPYQHLYYTLMLPLLRVSWTLQSIVHVYTALESPYKKNQSHVRIERIGIAMHWTWVFLQLCFLPNFETRIIYFIVSQFFGGLFIAMVVTYNHNSVDKFPENCRLLNNFAALHILTTRNMKPSRFVDWFWGGLNYQIEHHLFPTMPRSNLTKCSILVKEFCAENGLPYLADNYLTGYKHSLKLLQNVAEVQKMLKLEKKIKL